MAKRHVDQVATDGAPDGVPTTHPPRKVARTQLDDMATDTRKPKPSKLLKSGAAEGRKKPQENDLGDGKRSPGKGNTSLERVQTSGEIASKKKGKDGGAGDGDGVSELANEDGKQAAASDKHATAVDYRKHTGTDRHSMGDGTTKDAEMGRDEGEGKEEGAKEVSGGDEALVADGNKEDTRADGQRADGGASAEEEKGRHEGGDDEERAERPSDDDAATVADENEDEEVMRTNGQPADDGALAEKEDSRGEDGDGDIEEEVEEVSGGDAAPVADGDEEDSRTDGQPAEGGALAEKEENRDGDGEDEERAEEVFDDDAATVADEDGKGMITNEQRADSGVSKKARNGKGEEGLKSAEPYFEVKRLPLRKRKKQKPGRRRAIASASKVQEQQKSSNYRIVLTEAARAKGILEWEKLLKLDNVSYEGGEYRPGDNVYICTTEPGGPPASDPAQIVEIRQTGDERRRKDICVAWLYSRDQLANKKGANWTEMWRMGASHVVSNSYQILPWDTINSAAERCDVRTHNKVRVDVSGPHFDLRLCNDPAVRWVD